jgi:hypothetical protein
MMIRSESFRARQEKMLLHFRFVCSNTCASRLVTWMVECPPAAPLPRSVGVAAAAGAGGRLVSGLTLALEIEARDVVVIVRWQQQRW